MSTSTRVNHGTKGKQEMHMHVFGEKAKLSTTLLFNVKYERACNRQLLPGRSAWYLLNQRRCTPDYSLNTIYWISQNYFKQNCLSIKCDILY